MTTDNKKTKQSGTSKREFFVQLLLPSDKVIFACKL